MPNPGDIKYIEKKINGKTIFEKQKYYKVQLDSGPFDANKPSYIASVYGIKDVTARDYYDEVKKLSFNVLSILPDTNIDLSNINKINSYVKINSKYAEYKFIDYKTNIDTIRDETYYDIFYLIGEVLDTMLEGQQYNFIYEKSATTGVFEIEGWASYNKKEKDESAIPPSALDKDWTIDEVIDKQQDLQYWADNNLLPPIFGPTNCVYFPSNLGNTKPDDLGVNEGRNPIIKKYPVLEGYLELPRNNTYKYYEMKYPITDKFIQIKGKKDDVFSFNCIFPNINDKSCRFSVIQDDQIVFGDYINGAGVLTPGSITAKDPFPNACDDKNMEKVDIYKVNQFVELRFIEQTEAENPTLFKEQKFNKYIMQGLITSVNINYNQYGKSQISVKLIQDYGLNEENYYNAKIVITGTSHSNFVQNETFSIQRYYKKDLGIGPRLGGSIMQTDCNNSSGNYLSSNNLFIYTSVLKDLESLNKPYLNISYSGDFGVHVDVFNLTQETLNLSYDFSDADLSGQFKKVGNIINGVSEQLSKQYLPYNSYLIKNLDEHDYEYYQQLKKASRIKGLYIFRESNENADLTFGSYE